MVPIRTRRRIRKVASRRVQDEDIEPAMVACAVQWLRLPPSRPGGLPLGRVVQTRTLRRVRPYDHFRSGTCRRHQALKPLCNLNINADARVPPYYGMANTSPPKFCRAKWLHITFVFLTIRQR